MPKLRPRKKQLTAVGCFIFAGGFTVGVKAAGFDVLCHLEGDGGYGVPTVRLNFPDLPIYFGSDKWPLDALSDIDVDYVFGNPPCLAGFTNVLTESGWRTIASLAAEDFNGEVATVTEKGTIEYRRVLKHHVNPYAGQMMRVRFVHGGGAARGKKRAVVTQEHKFMTRRGWVAAMDLCDDDLVATGEAAPDVVQTAAIDGMLLGDAKVSKQPQFSTAQTAHQLVLLKSLLLSSLGTKTVTVEKSSDDGYERKDQTYLSVKTGVWVRQQRERWYPNGVKIVPRDVVLEDVTLAMWFMDDGCGKALTWSEKEEYQSRRKGPWVSLATHGFTDEDIEFLIKKLADRGMFGEALRRKTGYVDVEVRGESAIRFFDAVAPWVTPDMRYKLPPGSREYDPTLYAVRAETVGWDHVIVEKDYVSKWGKVYCIDVEETHNFVTLGGVVHNCAAWSGNNPNSHKANAWRNDPRVCCTEQHFHAMEVLRPKVWCWESVTQAPKKGRELVDEFTGKALGMGYSVTELFHDARYMGTPQTRKRWFMVCHRVELDFDAADLLPEISAVDALSKVTPRGPPAYDSGGNRQFDVHLPQIPPGYRLRKYQEENMSPAGGWTVKPNGHMLGKVGFGHTRLRDVGPASATVGYAMVHPTEHRFLTVNEVQALAGFPDDYEFTGGQNGAQQLDLIARGVCPPVGEWLARRVREGLERGKMVTGPTVRVIDLTGGPSGVKRRVSERRVIMPELRPRFSQKKSVIEAEKGDAAQPVPQPTRNQKHGKLGHPGSKPQDLDRRYDTTQLHENGHGQRVHRDYAAHFFRWGWASRFVRPGTRVLDVGCGQDLPLVKILTASLSTVPAAYVGIDLNKIRRTTTIKWVETVRDQFDFPGGGWREIKKEHELFDLISCFEVIEHMHEDSGKNLLVGMRECLADDGKILLSTPVYDGRKMAANHIHEYKVEELQTLIESVGLEVVERFGTFASWNAVRRVCTESERQLLDETGRFYGGDVLACFLAPKYPDASRNNAWVLKKKSKT